MNEQAQGFDLKALIVDHKSAAALELSVALAPEFNFSELDFTNSLYKALQSFREAEYNVCFIADGFSDEDSTSFFRDLQAIQRSHNTVVVQVRDSLPQDFDRSALCSAGYHFIISRKGTHSDKAGLEEILASVLHDQKLSRKVHGVDRAMNIILSEIDRAADNLRRGAGTQLPGKGFAGNFIAGETELDSEILEQYFKHLENKTAAAEPTKAYQLQVPEQIMDRQLPNLSENTYSGVSHRVWKKLSRRYGVMFEESAGQRKEKSAGETEILEASGDGQEPSENASHGHAEHESVPEPADGLKRQD